MEKRLALVSARAKRQPVKLTATVGGDYNGRRLMALAIGAAFARGDKGFN